MNTPPRLVFARLDSVTIRSMTAQDFQLLAQILAGTAAAAAIVLSVVRDRHPLTLIERLTAIARDVSSTEVRALVEEERDRRMVRFVLLQQAPPERRLRGLGILLRVIAVVALLAWLTVALIEPNALWNWAVYAVALVSIGVAHFFESQREEHRTNWIEQERQWRRLPAAAASSRVNSTST